MLYFAYTREDALFAIQLAEDLTALGIDVWLDLNEIRAGADWEAAQRAAIEASEGLLAVLSPEAMQRDHMQREIQQAFAKGQQVFVAAARRAPWQDWLNGLPVADFTQDYETGLNQLVLAITGTQHETPSQLDDADRWLQHATRISPEKSGTREGAKDKPHKSLIARLLKR